MEFFKKTKAVFAILIFFILINIIFSFQKRISFLVYNPYNDYLMNWQGKVSFTFNELNISSCSSVNIDKSYLTNSFNELLPFISYCDNNKKRVYLIFQIPTIAPHEAQKLSYYYDGENKIYLEVNPNKIEGFCSNNAPKECVINISFPFPALLFNYYKILFDFKIEKPGTLAIKNVLTIKLDKCSYKTVFQQLENSKEDNTEAFEECINARISNKRPIKIKLIFSNLDNTVSASQIINNIKKAKLLFYYPVPNTWGINYKEGKYYNYFYSLDVSNTSKYISIEDNLGKVLILNLTSSYFGVYLNDTNLLPNNLSEVEDNLVFIRFSNISNSLFNKKPLIINESSRLNIFNIEKHENENFTNYFNIRAFDSWIRMFFKNNEYYKTEKIIELYNPDNVSYSNALLNLTIDKSSFHCYYYYCNDFELFYNDSGEIKPLKYRLNNCNETHCNFDVLIPYLAGNSTFKIFSYSNNKYSFLNKSQNFNLPLVVYLPNYVISSIYDAELPNKISKNYFKLVFEIPFMNKVYYSYYTSSDTTNLQFNVLNEGNYEFNNTNNEILNDLLVYLNNKNGILINFNKYVGYYNQNLLKKGDKNWKLLIDLNNKKIILEGNNAFLDNLLLSFAPIGFVNTSLLNNNNYYDLNLSFDLDNAEKLKEYIKESYVFLNNNLTDSFYPLFQPTFYLANNTKGILLETKNSKIGLTSYNLIWEDKRFYYFLGNYYPITTRKGKGIVWKVFPAIHLYTNYVSYNILNYLLFYKKTSDLSFYLKNQDLVIIK